jgi:hypothetical protein
MFPCEMARYIAGFPREARKYGRFRPPKANRFLAAPRGFAAARPARDQAPDWGLTGSDFSILRRSADISWLPRVLPEAELAAAAVAAPDGRPGPPDAAGAAAEPAGAVAAPVLLSAALGAVEAAAQPGVRVQRVRPAAWALQAPQRVSLAEGSADLAFACPRVFQGSALHCPLSAGLPAVPTDSFPAFSGCPRPRHQTQPPSPPETSSWPICYQG